MGFEHSEGENQAADVAADDYCRSPYYHSLNGTWKFHYVPRPAE